MDDEPKVQQLENRIDSLESTIEKMMPSRRDALKMGGAALAGGSLMAGTASAGTNQVGTIGSASQPVDVESEDINNADTVTTQNLVATNSASVNGARQFERRQTINPGGQSSFSIGPFDLGQVRVILSGVETQNGPSSLELNFSSSPAVRFVKTDGTTGTSAPIPVCPLERFSTSGAVGELLFTQTEIASPLAIQAGLVHQETGTNPSLLRGKAEGGNSDFVMKDHTIDFSIPGDVFGPVSEFIIEHRPL